MALERLHFGIERRDVLGAVIVGEQLEPQPLEHRRPLLRPALLGVERHDAPGDEVRPGKEVILALACPGSARRRGESRGADAQIQIERQSNDLCGSADAMHGEDSCSSQSSSVIFRGAYLPVQTGASQATGLAGTAAGRIAAAGIPYPHEEEPAGGVLDRRASR